MNQSMPLLRAVYIRPTYWAWDHGRPSALNINGALLRLQDGNKTSTTIDFLIPITKISTDSGPFIHLHPISISRTDHLQFLITYTILSPSGSKLNRTSARNLHLPPMPLIDSTDSPSFYAQDPPSWHLPLVSLAPYNTDYPMKLANAFAAMWSAPR